MSCVVVIIRVVLQNCCIRGRSVYIRDVNEARHLEAKAKTGGLEAEAEIEARGSRPRPRTRPK